MSINKKYILNKNIIDIYQKNGIPGIKKLLSNHDVLIVEQGLGSNIIELLDEPIPYYTESEKWDKISLMIKESQ